MGTVTMGLLGIVPGSLHVIACGVAHGDIHHSEVSWMYAVFFQMMVPISLSQSPCGLYHPGCTSSRDTNS